MAEYQLTVRAQSQLIDIYDFSVATFGTYQAEAYLAGLERTFDLLANFPRIGQLADELAPRHRRFHFQSHTIFYTDEDTHVLIRAIYHRAQDIGPQLFD
ncbi:type II toxin-antitoxin system RelE/ParE family toxin [Bradyrhizobium lablabi]|uniref:type II toxin-antitoxin system RelE/ParE family toxin n=1 Tax=Bradyrhizobium lablabi TaxID=722472 RepID=UPI001BAB3A54|nr:type II toxin-antitoxin system RelE/ParE family toxin [Bradyrhizobium lablabi]MBR1124462.1 type II toxin-antitoxin system RelE/ParE family toxin [Bradyrhizobium lablabi]